MFITHETDRHQLFSAFSGGAENTTYWRRFELALFRPWFMVTLSIKDLEEETKDSPVCFLRTMCIAEVGDLINLLKQNQGDQITIRAVQVVDSEYKSERQSWSLHDVKAIWAAEQLIDGAPSGVEVEIIETVDGVMHPTIPMGDLCQGRKGLRLIHEM